MPRNLQRFHHSGQSHFVTFSCYHRRSYFSTPDQCDLFVHTLEEMRHHFQMCVYGYVVMPEHVHLLVNEPPQTSLADAIHYLKLSFAKRVRTLRPVPQVRVPLLDSGLVPQVRVPLLDAGLVPQVRVPLLDANLGTFVLPGPHPPVPFWQKRYYDRNVRDYREFMVKLRYLHRNPVKRGLVREPGDWPWSSYRHYAFREIGVVEIESEWTAAIGKRKSTVDRRACSLAQVSARNRARTWGTRRMASSS